MVLAVGVIGRFPNKATRNKAPLMQSLHLSPQNSFPLQILCIQYKEFLILIIIKTKQKE